VAWLSHSNKCTSPESTHFIESGLLHENDVYNESQNSWLIKSKSGSNNEGHDKTGGVLHGEGTSPEVLPSSVLK
jgi:hypothetical protein